jgi:putative addiction module CopG family antidote
MMETKLGTFYDNFIDDAVVSGRYESKDEVLRKAIMLLSYEEQHKNVLREQLTTGENSPIIEDFNPQEYLNRIHRKYL